MSKSLSTIKKFQFFDFEKPGEGEVVKQRQSVTYILDNITPVEFRVYNNLYFVCGLVSGQDDNRYFRLIKVQQFGKIIDEYAPFTDTIINFDLIETGGKVYLIALGTDLRSPTDKFEGNAVLNTNNQLNKEQNSVKVTPTKNSIPSIKIFDFQEFVDNASLDLKEEADKSASDEDKKKSVSKFIADKFKPKCVIYLMRKKDSKTEFFQGNSLSELNDSFEPITNFNCFNVSPKINYISFSEGNDILYEVKCDDIYNLMNAKERKIVAIKSPDTKNITNIKYLRINNNQYLYFTTTEGTFYKNCLEAQPVLVGDQNMHSGAEEKNFDVSPDKILLSTPGTYYLEEYSYFADESRYLKIRSKVFDKPTKFLNIFKGYQVFVLYEENICTFCVYDPNNNIFVSYNNGLNNILSVLTDKEKIYVLTENSNMKKIVCFKEKDNKEKFDTFYKKNFYETAFNYAKSLGYDKKKLSEISKLHAEHLYKKGDYEKSIEQYKQTINHLDPSYVIQKFLDGSKLNFLIDYLEALQNNEEFKRNCIPERLKDFTALLLNCYIKQKQIKKLKEFVESKNINDEVTIKTAIEVCKDTNKIDLALSIAQKAKMVESYIQILMDIKNDFAQSLDFIKTLTDIEQKFNLLLKYGEKFIEKKDVIDDAMKVITSIVNDIIIIRNKDPCPKEEEKIKNLNYEKIISIFITKESEEKLETLLDNIMNKDKDCPKQIILRRIELYVDRYAETRYGSEIVDKIREILVNEKFKNKLDKNYLLMLFKISGFSQGVTELSKIMELDQDLLQIYMETHEYQKINSSCDAIMKKYAGSNKKVNYWLQALNYYISISTQTTKGYLGDYIIEVLDHLANSKEEDFSPMILLDILDKARSNHGHIIEFKVIKKYIIDWIKKQQESLKNDKKITEENYSKIEQNNQQLKELQVKAKPYNLSKCSICGQPLDIPFVYFTCGHGFHQLCINGESYEEIECSTCKAKNNLLLSKIEAGKQLAEKPKEFFDKIKKDDNVKKFDIFAEYLGKGVFINKNDEPEQKVESNTINTAFI